MAASSIAAADPLVHVAFNRDATHLVAATSSAIRVFSCSPLKDVFSSRGGFASVDSSGGHAGEVVTSADLGGRSTSLLAVVFGDTIRYWSEPEGLRSANTIIPSAAHGAVRAVRHVGDYVLVAGEERVTLHEISCHGAAKQIMEVDTGPNPLGLCALAQVDGGEGFVLACPSPTAGEVQIWHKGRSEQVDAQAHHRLSVGCIELSGDGKLLATADSTGTTVRISSTADGLMRQELIVGCGTRVIYCMAFSQDSRWLAVSSDRAEVHMFIVHVDLTPWRPPSPSIDGDPPYMNPHQRAFMIAHCTASWSMATFCLDEGTRYRIAFGQEPNTIYMIGMDGSFYRCQYDQVKGRMKQIEHRNVMGMA